MDQARQFINMVGAGDNVSAKDLVDSILSARAFEALEAKKQDLAATLFSGVMDAGVSEPVTVGEETELNLEDFSPEEIEAFMQTEDFEQLDELSKETMNSYLKKTKSELRKFDKGETQLSRYMDNKSNQDRYSNSEFGRNSANKKLGKKSDSQFKKHEPV